MDFISCTGLVRFTRYKSLLSAAHVITALLVCERGGGGGGMKKIVIDENMVVQYIFTQPIMDLC